MRAWEFVIEAKTGKTSLDTSNTERVVDKFSDDGWDVGDICSIELMEEYGHLFREGMDTSDLDAVEQFLMQWPGIETMNVGDLFFPVSVHATILPFQNHPSLMTLAHFEKSETVSEVRHDWCRFSNTVMRNSRVPEMLKHVIICRDSDDFEQFKTFLIVRFAGSAGSDWKIQDKTL